MKDRRTGRRHAQALAATAMAAVALGGFATSAAATFPGENGQIAYAVYGLYVSDPTGTVRTQIHPVGPRPNWSHPRDPQFFPDGERIAYSYEADIYVSRLDGADRVNLTANEPWAVDPAPSPAGEIAFARSTGRTARALFVMDDDGTDVRQITSGEARDEDPVWSPEGDRIVFTRTPVGEDGYLDGPAAIYAVDPDGTDLTALSSPTQSPYGGGASFTPDGDHILFRRGGGLIYLMNEDGTNPHQLVESGHAKDVTNVVASPDGSGLAFTRAFVDQCEPVGDCITHDELILSAADGSGGRTLRKSGYIQDIDWGPAPEGGLPQPDATCDGRDADIVGTPLPDSITGTDGADVIASLRGPDWVDAGAGDDVACGGEGDQEISGGGGGDLLIPGPGRDRVLGNTGSDSVSLRDGETDSVRCGGGLDVVRADRIDEVARSCERVRR